MTGDVECIRRAVIALGIALILLACQTLTIEYRLRQLQDRQVEADVVPSRERPAG